MYIRPSLEHHDVATGVAADEWRPSDAHACVAHTPITPKTNRWTPRLIDREKPTR